MHVQRGIAAFSRSDFWLLQEKLAMKLPSSDKSFEPRQYECPYTSDNKSLMVKLSTYGKQVFFL